MATSLNEFIGQELLWQPTAAMKARYELVASNTIVASFDMSNWRSRATAHVLDSSFSIKREGTFQPLILIRSGNEDDPPLATFRRKWSGGVLQFADGRTFTWRKINFWASKRAWLDATEQPVMIFQPRNFSRTMNVSIAPAASSLSDLPVLAILGLYMIILVKREAAAAAASA